MKIKTFDELPDEIKGILRSQDRFSDAVLKIYNAGLRDGGDIHPMRFEAAKAAMQGFAPRIKTGDDYAAWAAEAVNLGDALIEELKKGKP